MAVVVVSQRLKTVCERERAKVGNEPAVSIFRRHRASSVRELTYITQELLIKGQSSRLLKSPLAPKGDTGRRTVWDNFFIRKVIVLVGGGGGNNWTLKGARKFESRNDLP